jgi:hypothetical protein
MAQPVMHQVHPVNVDQTGYPDHFVMWLDKHIGKPEECVLLKCSLFLAVDPTTGLYERMLNQDDINRSIRLNTSFLVRLDEVEFLFQAFVDVEKCFETIEANLHKRIFLITSGSKGRIIVPSVMTNFPDTFVPNYRMYIFCANTIMRSVDGCAKPTNTWALDFLANILMLNHQDDLFARMVSDIAEYFFTKAEHLENDQPDSACQYLIWSKHMFRRYGMMENKNMTTKITEVDQRIKAIERRRKQEDDDDEHVGETCS